MNERREAGGGGAVPEASVHLTPGARAARVAWHHKPAL